MLPNYWGTSSRNVNANEAGAKGEGERMFYRASMNVRCHVLQHRV